jgi:hypothetical protein
MDYKFSNRDNLFVMKGVAEEAAQQLAISTQQSATSFLDSRYR